MNFPLSFPNKKQGATSPASSTQNSVKHTKRSREVGCGFAFSSPLSSIPVSELKILSFLMGKVLLRGGRLARAPQTGFEGWCLTVDALPGCWATNGVSQLHGLYPPHFHQGMHKMKTCVAVACLRNLLDGFKFSSYTRNTYLHYLNSSLASYQLKYFQSYFSNLQFTFHHIVSFIIHVFAKMCRQLQCYYDCGHKDIDISRCSYEKGNAGRCRRSERPDIEHDTGLCEGCRDKELRRTQARIWELRDRVERLSSPTQPHGYFDYHDQGPSEWGSRGSERQEYSDRGSNFGSEGDDQWTMIERAPATRRHRRSDSPDSWRSMTLSDGSGGSGRSGRSRGSDPCERVGRSRRR